jgi:hypothetical protein
MLDIEYGIDVSLVRLYCISPDEPDESVGELMAAGWRVLLASLILTVALAASSAAPANSFFGLPTGASMKEGSQPPAENPLYSAGDPHAAKIEATTAVEADEAAFGKIPTRQIERP